MWRGRGIPRLLLISIAVVIIVIGGVAAWYLTRPPKPEVLKLGCHEPLSGALAKHGEGSLRGIKIAIKHFEEDYGYKVELVVYDDESSPEKAAEVVEKLCTIDKVVAITGGYGSHIVGSASEVAEKNKVIYVTSGAIAKVLTERGFKYFFRLTTLPGYAMAQVEFAAAIGIKKVAILYNTKVATTDIAIYARSLFEEKGIETVLFEGYSPGTAEFKPLLTKAIGVGAEALIVEGYFPDYVATIRDCKVLDAPFTVWIGAWGVMTHEFIKELGDLSEYVYGTSPWIKGAIAPELRDEEERFIKDHVEEFEVEPDYLSVIGYSHTRVLLEAIRRVIEAGLPLTSDNIREEMLRIDMITLAGAVKFDESGNNVKYTVLLLQIQKGEFVAIWPPERKTGDAVYPATPWRSPE